MKLLVLTSSTGGGHDLRANALCAWTEKETDLGIETDIFRPLEGSTALNRFGVRLYNDIQRNLPVAHHVYWSFLEVAGLHRKPGMLGGTQPFIEKLESYRPDWVISVHAHLNHGYMALARQVLGPDKVKVGTYCGEMWGGYGFSRHWVNPTADLFIGATEACCTAARHIGMPEARNMLGGFMLRPASYTPSPSPKERAEYLRKQFGFDPERFTLLLATGAVGANNHLRLFEALDASGLDLQVIALCGKRPETLQRVAAWKPRSAHLSVQAIPYCEDMPKLLGSVSAIVARGGTGTTSEAILAGCPIIINALGAPMPQEMITLKYLRSQGITEQINRTCQLPEIIRPWLENPSAQEAARQRMRAALPPGSPRAILERLCGEG